MSNKVLIYMVSWMFLLGVHNVFADSAGDALAERFFDLAKSSSSVSDSSIIIIDAKGNKRVRVIKRYSRENGKVTESFLEFLKPADVAGTKFLTHSEQGKDDEQRLFLPALGKVRRIASSDKGGSFMGTDLTYYDMEEHYIEDFTFKALGNDTVNKQAVQLLELTPLSDEAPYSKIVYFLSEEHNFPLRMDFYDEKGTLIKKLFNIKYTTINGVIIAERVVVENLQTKQKTLLDVSNIQINVSVPDRVFSIQNLAR